MVGRFVGEDPIGFNAQDANLYRYVLNTPIQGTDPTGLLVVTPVPAPVATPWYVPLLRRIPLAIPFVIPGGLLNPQRTNPYEFPRDLPQNKRKPCPTRAPLDPPWKDKDKWPKNCQLNFQVPGPPGSGYDTCAYVCKEWGPKDTIRRLIIKGGTCPKWLDWIPDEVPSE